MTRTQKLKWYANQLMTDAAAYEKTGNAQGAIDKYLQAADILLLLGKVEESYTAWKNYTDMAAQCQHKVRMLVATTPPADSSG